jgi:hypothetical protein
MFQPRNPPRTSKVFDCTMRLKKYEELIKLGECSNGRRDKINVNVASEGFVESGMVDLNLLINSLLCLVLSWKVCCVNLHSLI